MLFIFLECKSLLLLFFAYYRNFGIIRLRGLQKNTGSGNTIPESNENKYHLR